MELRLPIKEVKMTDFTIEFWFKAEKQSSSSSSISSSETRTMLLSGFQGNLQILYDKAYQKLILQRKENTIINTESNSFLIDRWHHLVITTLNGTSVIEVYSYIQDQYSENYTKHKKKASLNNKGVALWVLNSRDILDYTDTVSPALVFTSKFTGYLKNFRLWNETRDIYIMDQYVYLR